MPQSNVSRVLTGCSMLVAATAKRGQLQVVAAKKDKKGKLMWEALREAVDEEMEKDPNVCVIGMIAFPPSGCP